MKLAYYLSTDSPQLYIQLNDSELKAVQAATQLTHPHCTADISGDIVELHFGDEGAAPYPIDQPTFGVRYNISLKFIVGRKVLEREYALHEPQFEFIEKSCLVQLNPITAPAPNGKAHDSAYVAFIKKFLDENTTKKPGARIPCADLYAYYEKWAKSQRPRRSPGPKAFFTRAMKELGAVRSKYITTLYYLDIVARTPTAKLAGYTMHIAPGEESGAAYDLNRLKVTEPQSRLATLKSEFLTALKQKLASENLQLVTLTPVFSDDGLSLVDIRFEAKPRAVKIIEF